MFAIPVPPVVLNLIPCDRSFILPDLSSLSLPPALEQSSGTCCLPLSSGGPITAGTVVGLTHPPIRTRKRAESEMMSSRRFG